jgi:hypothetical protein
MSESSESIGAEFGNILILHVHLHLPGVNPTIVSYSASSASSLARFESKNSFFYFSKKRSTKTSTTLEF